MADIPQSLRQWSTTAASNQPQGTTTLGAGLDDNLRSIVATVRQYLASKGSDMASATTVDLSTADGSFVDVTGTTTITGLGTEAAGISYLLRFTGILTFTHNGTSLSLPGAANITTANGDMALMTSLGSGNWKCAFYQKASGTSVIGFNPPGAIIDYAGSSAPTGWLECDGSAVSRTTYADLFSAVSTTWGAGDGSTTFNIPDFRGRARIGKGTGVVTEAVTASSSNGFTVASNNTKWITGMAVVLSSLTGFTTSATAGPTYYAVRVSATNVRLATTLALAQAGSPDVTLSGTGTATLTTTFTARTLGENGGEQSHAISSTEMLAHTHTYDDLTAAAGGQGTLARTSAAGSASSSFGGNAAMNIMQPFAATMTIIKT
jgi:microcystin-dependent protein